MTTQELWLNRPNKYRLITEQETRQAEDYKAEEQKQEAEIERLYESMYRDIEREIMNFYGKYASAEGIDITEAKKRVSEVDIKAYEALAQEYVEKKRFTDQANAEMRLYNATMKINRLELLKAQIGLHIVDNTNELDRYYQRMLINRTTKELERQAGILGSTVTDAEVARRAKAIVNHQFYNATYSQRLWSHADRLRSAISIELQRGFIAGLGSRAMADRLRQQVSINRRDAQTLMVTELRRVQTDVAMDIYKDTGTERYVFLAVNPEVNSRICPKCRELTGKDFAVSEAEAGVNAPPMHPRCHCTTAPYIDESDYNAWLNYLDQGGTTAEWNNMSLAERQMYAPPVVQSEPKKGFDRNNVQWTPDGEHIKNWCEHEGIEYREVKDLPKKLGVKEIVSRIAGGDMTKGSCVSLACSYIANKAGWDVLDFRGGKSCHAFALSYNNMRLAKLSGVKAIENNEYSSVKGAQALMGQMEQDKDYMLVTGKHASIVRKTDSGFQYLELQSGSENGWTDFDSYGSTAKTLQKRFGCTKSRTVYGQKFQQHSFAIDIESLYNSDEFRDLLGYINTAESAQKKGASGSVK